MSQEFDDLLSDAAGEDPMLMVAMMDAANELRAKLGSDQEAWRGAMVVMDIVGDAFAHYFGHDIIHHRRKAPHPDQVMAFAYVVALAHATVNDGPPT